MTGIRDFQWHEEALADNLRALEDYSPEPKDYRGVSIIFGGHSHGAHFVFSDHARYVPNTSILLEIKNKQTEEGGVDFLLDAGAGCFESYNRLGISLRNLRAILISHNHLDHVDDLRRILLMFRPEVLRGERGPIELIANGTVFRGGAGYPPLLWGSFFRGAIRKRMLNHGDSVSLFGARVTSVPSHHVEHPERSSTTNSYRIDIRLADGAVHSLGVLCDGPLVGQEKTKRKVVHVDAIAPMEGVNTLVLYLGTTSEGPLVPGHDPIFDTATCLHGARAALEYLASRECMPDRIFLTHFGAETYDIRSAKLSQFLENSGYTTEFDYAADQLDRTLRELGAATTTVAVPRIGERITLMEAL
ncbi:MAG: MBL fold metallo-hydrolase [Dehalococcoidia bacterium]|nr:MBL fold metallo-hydrolase [Dehalococcoidia bacterium]